MHPEHPLRRMLSFVGMGGAGGFGFGAGTGHDPVLAAVLGAALALIAHAAHDVLRPTLQHLGVRLARRLGLHAPARAASATQPVKPPSIPAPPSGDLGE